MLKSKLNQELESVINLMGEQVSFVKNIKIKDKFDSQHIQGVVTDIVLSLHGNHQISVNGGDFFFFSEIIDFKVLDPK